MFYIFGLGNPGEEYQNTRHNTGRIISSFFAKTNDFPDFASDKIFNSLLAEKKVGKEKVAVILPETFMNKSGEAVKKIKDLKKKVVGKGKEKMTEIENLVLIHDDLDLPIGRLKLSFNKGSGGHKGVESVIKALKSEAFLRIRVGISPVTPSGKMKKPSGEKEVGDFILAKFKTAEMDELKKVSKKAADILSVIISEGRSKAMSTQNG